MHHWRVLAAIPLYAVGSFQALLIKRTSQRIHQAIQLGQIGGWEAIVEDPGFNESVILCTTVPPIGFGLIAVAYGIHRRRRVAIFGGILLIIGVSAAASLVFP